MAQQTKSTLKGWFQRGMKPLASQFSDWMDSYWHKSENIPAANIAGLQGLLDAKAEAETIEQLAGSIGDLSDTVSGIEADVDVLEEAQAATATTLENHTSNTGIHITAAERTAWNGKHDALTFDAAPTIGSTNPVESGGVKTYVDGAIAALPAAYHPKGSVSFANLPYEGMAAGDVYNITDSFTTDNRFEDYEEGVTKTYGAGTNVAYTENGKWDAQCGIVDLSPFQKKTDNALETTSKTVVGAINELQGGKVNRGVDRTFLLPTQPSAGGSEYVKLLSIPTGNSIVMNVSWLTEGMGTWETYDRVMYGRAYTPFLQTLSQKDVFATPAPGSDYLAAKMPAFGSFGTRTLRIQIVFCSCPLSSITWFDDAEGTPDMAGGEHLYTGETVKYYPPEVNMETGTTVAISAADKTAGHKDIDMAQYHDFILQGCDGLPAGFFLNAVATAGEYYDPDYIYRFAVDAETTGLVVRAGTDTLFSVTDTIYPNDILNAVPPATFSGDWNVSLSKSQNISSDGTVGIASTEDGRSDFSVKKLGNSLTLSIEGGSTEGTDMATFNGQLGKNLDITLAKLGGLKYMGRDTLDITENAYLDNCVYGIYRATEANGFPKDAAGLSGTLIVTRNNVMGLQYGQNQTFIAGNGIVYTRFRSAIGPAYPFTEWRSTMPYSVEKSSQTTSFNNLTKQGMHVIFPASNYNDGPIRSLFYSSDNLYDQASLLIVLPYDDGDNHGCKQLCYSSSSLGNTPTHQGWYVRTYNSVAETFTTWSEFGGTGSADLSSYQLITDNTLETTSKTVPGAINEVLGRLNASNVEYFSYSLVEKAEMIQGLSLAQRGMCAWAFMPTISSKVSKLKFICTSDAGGQIQLALYTYEGVWSNADTTIPVQIVGTPVTHTVVKGMNIVTLSGTATLNPDKLYYAVAMNVSGFSNLPFMARSATLPAPSADIVAMAVEGQLASGYTLAQLSDLRSQAQVNNNQYPQGTRTVPWFMLS